MALKGAQSIFSWLKGKHLYASILGSAKYFQISLVMQKSIKVVPSTYIYHYILINFTYIIKHNGSYYFFTL
jgi:hypothetical protein